MTEEIEEPSMEVGESEAPKKIFSLTLHSLLDEYHSAHGLAHTNDDYQQYRRYCTRRLSRLRHAQPVRHDLVHSSSGGGSGRHHKRHAFVKRDLIPSGGVQHVNVLLVLLLQAERAWAHASELKALLLLSPSIPKGHEKSKASPGSIRQHALHKLKKAQVHAQQLQELVEEYGDVTTQQEAKAYAAWMSGNVALEKGQWKVSLVLLQLEWSSLDTMRTNDLRLL
jgi:signal recognition particle subunit SRP68